MISIHSTTRVETRCRSHLLPPLLNFNPLHHEGGDVTQFLHSLLYEISIHSTTRVETRLHRKRLGGRKFQSTPPRGWRRYRPVQNAESVQDFNPLHHEGGDFDLLPIAHVLKNFNPLHHEGGDLGLPVFAEAIEDFNPLHHEGGDSNTTQ